MRAWFVCEAEWSSKLALLVGACFEFSSEIVVRPTPRCFLEGYAVKLLSRELTVQGQSGYILRTFAATIWLVSLCEASYKMGSRNATRLDKRREI